MSDGHYSTDSRDVAFVFTLPRVLPRLIMLANTAVLAPITLGISSASVELTTTDADLCLMTAAGRNVCKSSGVEFDSPLCSVLQNPLVLCQLPGAAAFLRFPSKHFPHETQETLPVLPVLFSLESCFPVIECSRARYGNPSREYAFETRIVSFTFIAREE